MKKKPFLPLTQLGYIAWQDTFVTAATALAGPLGLTGADTTALTNRNTDLHNKYNVLQSAQNAAKAATVAYNTAENDSRLGEPSVPYLRPYDVFNYFPEPADWLSEARTEDLKSYELSEGMIL